MTLISEIAPIFITAFVAWAGWLTKMVIDMKVCNSGTNQKLDDFVTKYNEHLEK